MARSMKKTSFAVIGAITIILLMIIGLAYNPIPFVSPLNTDAGQNGQLIVTGLVDTPLNLTLAEITDMPQTTVNATIICVDFPGNIVKDGNWTGVKLKTLLEMANPSAGVVKVAFFASDGYSTDLTIQTAMHDDIIVAYQNNGEALSSLRLVVPGKWGYKWISMLTRIELVNYNFLGRWESQGYSDEADISEGSPGIGILNPLYPNVAATPTPATSPSPSPSQSPVTSQPSDQPTPTPATTQKTLSFPIEAIYAIAIAAIVGIVGFGAIVVRKRSK
jgi:hypothetical protein